MSKNDVFIRGNRLNLISLSEKHIEESNWYGWFNSEETTKHLQKHYFPNTVEDQKNILKSISSNRSKLQLGISEKDSNKLIGIVSLNNISTVNRNASFSLVIGEKKFRTLVYAEEAVSLILNHAFNTLNLFKVYGGAIETLEPWVKFLNKRYGFEIEGRNIKHVFKNGKYLDLINFYITSEIYNKPK